MTSPGVRLTPRELAAFAFVSVPLATGGLPLVLYLTPYYAAISGMSLTTIALVVTLTRVADIVTDPLIGVWSDRTPARYGRRGLWIALGLPVMAAGTSAVFNPPSAPGPLYLFMSVSVLLLGWTLIGIPLSAWTAELSHDYHERSRLAGARTWAGVGGALLAVIAPLLLSVLACGTVALLLMSVPFLLMNVRQPAFIARAPLDLALGLRLIGANAAFRRLLLSSMFAAIGWNSVHALFVFFATACLAADADQWPLIVLAYMVGQVIGTPFIVGLAPRFSKHRMLAVCSLISIGLFSLVLALGPGDYLIYAAINLLAGLFAPSITILGPSMAADVIDADHLASGRQRGALFMALWAMADKLAVVLAAAVALPLVQVLGFKPGAGRVLPALGRLHLALPADAGAACGSGGAACGEALAVIKCTLTGAHLPSTNHE